MERMTLNAQLRENFGKGAARSFRRSGSTPAVIYRKNKSNSLVFDSKEITKFIRLTGGDQVLVNIKLPDGEKLALLKDFQVDPVEGVLLHADFFEVSLKEKVKVPVHITQVGEPLGVKLEGGILQTMLREVEVECLPGDIPALLELDISELATGMSNHASDLELPENVVMLTSPEEVICTVIVPKVEAAPEPEEGELEEGEVPEGEVPEGETPEEGAEKKEDEKKEDA